MKHDAHLSRSERADVAQTMMGYLDFLWPLLAGIARKTFHTCSFSRDARRVFAERSATQRKTNFGLTRQKANETFFSSAVVVVCERGRKSEEKFLD
jgi:hypothetical protein